MADQKNINKQDILSKLEPRCCVYDTSETTNLLNVPQDETELMFVKDQLKENDFRLISRADARKLGYEEMANWSNDNDYLFISDDEWFILCMPKSLFEA